MDKTKLHRIYVSLVTEEQWYGIMRECRSWFGKNWKTQARVKRKLAEGQRYSRNRPSIQVWFEVPDPRIATWISVKYSLQVVGEDKYRAGK